MSFELIGLAVPAMFTLVGGIFAVAGVRMVVSWQAFRMRAVRCTGTVTEIRTKFSSRASGSGSRTIHYPVLAFRTTDGKDVQTQAMNGSSPTLLKEGQQVTVMYDPRNPTQAYAGRGFAGRLMPLIFLVVGGVVLAFGLWQLVHVALEILGDR